MRCLCDDRLEDEPARAWGDFRPVLAPGEMVINLHAACEVARRFCAWALANVNV
jgi:hypothetical protein